MKVKICGLHPARDVQLCIDLGVSLLGFIFYAKSPRNLDLKEVSKLKTYKKQKSLFVAVTVNPSDEFIKDIVLKNFDYIQLHGSESEERVKKIRSMGIKTIKAVKVFKEADINNYRKYNMSDIILFDTPGMEKSIEFPKNLITKLPKGERYALAGSISQSNIENLKKLGITFCDLSSSLETDAEIGYKDHQKINKFIKKLNEIKN